MNKLDEGQDRRRRATPWHNRKSKLRAARAGLEPPLRCTDTRNEKQGNECLPVKEVHRYRYTQNECLIVVAARNDFLAGRPQHNAVLELRRVAALDVAQGGVSLNEAFVAQGLEAHEVPEDTSYTTETRCYC